MPERSRDNGDRLTAYRAKRSADRTTEPFGSSAGRRPRFYCFQKHAARRMHYDLRLEWNGVLLSWAVPQGPSLDPEDKRLAVHTEDHPVDYGDFEGHIPKDNYGAGTVIVWDRGLWVPIDDPDTGLEAGKLHFELRGHKLGGEWILVRLKDSQTEWLLFKKNDSWADAKGQRKPPESSVLSGLTVEELRDGRDRGEAIRTRLDELGAPKGQLDVRTIEIMLAQTADEPFSHPDWVFELKYDGFRLLAARRPDGRATLRYRSGLDATALYPELALSVGHLPYSGLILDGEVVVHDEAGRPSFQRLQRRAMLSRRMDIEQASVELAATLYLFDLLAFDGRDVRPLPLVERKALLAQILPEAGPLRYSEHIPERGEAMYQWASDQGLEGVVAKRAASAYVGHRSDDWLKVLAARTAYFVIVGLTRPKRSRVGFGALHLAVQGADGLVYAGRVGTGFNDQLLKDLRAELDALVRPDQSRPPCAGPVPTSDDHLWVEPRLTCEVRYKLFTDDGLLRHPVFIALSDEVPPDSCISPDHPEAPPPNVEAVPDGVPDGAPTVTVTRPDKVFWPDEGYTKGDLVEYYRTVSPWLLPYLSDRPVVLTRYPDGIEGKSFFQKDAPDFIPGWIRTERMWSEHAEREIDYFVCENVETLAYLANLGTIPLHIWSSRIETLAQPDWTIVDLDPKEAPFEHVVILANAVGELCDSIDLPCFCKTSGSTGLHVLIPLGRQVSYEQSRMLANLIAVVIAGRYPDISTTARAMSARQGRVYLDFLQNGHGRLLVAPYSVRPRPGATCSTPLGWDEVNADLDPDRFTLRTLPERLAAMGADPLLPVLELSPDLPRVLARLGEQVEDL